MPTDPPLLVVDAANVVGSVPDGWWRDRAKATRRLRDWLALVAASGLDDPRAPEALRDAVIDVVLVVEGKARGVEGCLGVRVVAAEGSGDDAIVDVVREGAGRLTFVATADRELIGRVTELGAAVVGPRMVRR